MNFRDLAGRNILIYGVGAVSRVILPYLLYGKKVKIVGTATTAPDMCGTNYYLPSKGIMEWAKEEKIRETAVVLICTSQQYHQEILKLCKELKFNNIVPLTAALKSEITVDFFSDYLKRKNVSISDEILTIGNMRFVNPLIIKDIPSGTNLFNQMGDFIFPHCFQDWNILSEGPYIWGDVQLKENDIVLDCGANLGAFSVYAASQNCRSFAFEPTPELAPIIKTHSRLNGDRITLVSMAVSNQSGTEIFHLDPYSAGGSSLLVRGINTVPVQVKTTTIDDFVQQNHVPHVDFIKADIEGAERLLLEGAAQTLKKYCPKLSLCTYHLPDDKEVLKRLILNANPDYHIEYHWEKLYAYV